MFNEERKERVIDKMTELLGSASILEWCGNTSFFIAELLKANDGRPADLETHIAMNLTFMEIIKKFYNVDPEIMELEVNKYYRQLETIIDQVAVSNNENVSGNSPVIDFEERLSQLEAMVSNGGGNIIESSVVEVEELDGCMVSKLEDPCEHLQAFPGAPEGFVDSIPKEPIVDGQVVGKPESVSPIET